MPIASNLLLLPAILIVAGTTGGNWPDFRGPDGQGHSTSATAPLRWSESENVAWKSPLPGRGWSSPVIYGDQIWTTTAIETPATPEVAKALSSEAKASLVQLNPVQAVSLRALCVDRGTGRLVHDLELFVEKRPEPIHQFNSHASPSPVIEEGRVYCHFGRWGTACIDTETGGVIWKTALPNEHYVGPGSSPVMFEDVLVMTCDGADRQYVAALSKETGEIVWERDRPPITGVPDMRKSYATPLVVTAGGNDQVVMPGANWVVSYDPRSGEELWKVHYGMHFSLVPRPVSGDGRVFVCTGYMQPELWAMRVDGRGDVTETHVDWKVTKQVPTMSSPIVVDGRVYMVSERGIVTCMSAATGEVVWRERIGGNYSASLVAAPGRIYAFSREGKTTVFEPGAAYRELATNTLEGKIMATPAIVGESMMLRTAEHLYCIQEPNTR